MRVGVNARLLASPDRRGFNRYTAELTRALAAVGRVEPVLFSELSLHPVHGLGGVATVVAPVHPQFRWQHVWLPAALRRAGIDLFHAPAHWGIPWRCPCPTVATIHDLADRETPGGLTGPLSAVARHAFEQDLVVRRADIILTVSEWSARSIRRHLGVPDERIVVTVEGAAEAFRPVPDDAASAVRRDLRLPDRFFLYVGGLDERKNVGALVTALALLPPDRRVPIVLVAGRDGAASPVAEAARRAGVARWFHWVEPVDDVRLAALYGRALALLMPSWVEGFGLPVVEAMHCGTPSIVSDRGSLPEIGGDAVVTFPPEHASRLAERMLQVDTNPHLRADLAEKARARAAQFTWSRSAEQTVVGYERALSRGAG